MENKNIIVRSVVDLLFVNMVELNINVRNVMDQLYVFIVNILAEQTDMYHHWIRQLNVVLIAFIIITQMIKYPEDIRENNIISMKN